MSKKTILITGGAGFVGSNPVGAINCFEAATKYGFAVKFLSLSRRYPMDAIKSLDIMKTIQETS